MSEATPAAAESRVEKFSYDDAIVRMFVTATLVWGVVGMLVGVIIAAQLPFPHLNGGIEWITFGRLRVTTACAVAITAAPESRSVKVKVVGACVPLMMVSTEPASDGTAGVPVSEPGGS